VWFLCETRSSRYRVRQPSCEPCRFPLRPAKCEQRTQLQHIKVPTVPTRSRPSKRPRLRRDRGLRGAQRSCHDRNTGSGLGPLRDSNSRPRVRDTPPDAPSAWPALASQVPIRSLSHDCSAVLRGWTSRSPAPRFVSFPRYLPFGPCPYHRMYVETPHSFLPTWFHVVMLMTPFLRPRGAVPGITCHLPLFVCP